MVTEERINEIDLDELDGDLYTAWQKLQKGDYHSAQCLIAKSWRHVRMFLMSMDEEQPLVKNTGPAVEVHHTIYIGLVPALKRALYRLLNRLPLPCRGDYNCEWVYPCGFVPEGGCPIHD